jgi:hypothetical protein
MRRSRQVLFGDDTRKLELLRSRINRLELPLPGTLLDRCFRQVRRDLRRVGIGQMRPVFFLSNEYGTVVGTANIGVGFWDADPLLWELCRESRGTANSRRDILLLLRHECGHAFCYSYKLYRDKEFRRLFRVRGNFFWTYPKTDRYVPNPWSKDYVNPFGDHYAQKHPDDDFADTFAEFLAGGWRQRYRAKPGAMRKLRYVARMAARFGRKPPLVENDPRNLDQPVEEMAQTVREFLRAPVARYKERAKGFVDADLEEMFVRRRNGAQAASAFLAKFGREVESRAAAWSGAPAPVVRDILGKIRERADDLGLGVVDKRRTLVDVTAYVSALATRWVEVGKFK